MDPLHGQSGFDAACSPNTSSITRVVDTTLVRIVNNGFS
jgi:hypothetical protein